VGSGLELEQRLDDPVRPKAKPQRNSQAAEDDTFQEMHTFDITHSPASLVVWREHEAYTSKALRKFRPPLASSAKPTSVLEDLPSSTIAANEATAPKDDSQKLEDTIAGALKGLESHVSTFASFLNETSNTLRNAAEKARGNDLSAVSPILEGFKGIIGEVGKVGKAMIEAFDAEAFATPTQQAPLNPEQESRSKPNTKTAATPAHLEKEPQSGDLHKPPTHGSKNNPGETALARGSEPASTVVTDLQDERRSRIATEPLACAPCMRRKVSHGLSHHFLTILIYLFQISCVPSRHPSELRCHPCSSAGLPCCPSPGLNPAIRLLGAHHVTPRSPPLHNSETIHHSLFQPTASRQLQDSGVLPPRETAKTFTHPTYANRSNVSDMNVRFADERQPQRAAGPFSGEVLPEEIVQHPNSAALAGRPTPSSSSGTASRSILDLENNDPDFSVRYPPLMSLRRSKTLGGLAERARSSSLTNINPEAEIARFPSLIQFEQESRNRHRDKSHERLRPARSQFDLGRSSGFHDRPTTDARPKSLMDPILDAEYPLAPPPKVPGAWPDAKTIPEAPVLPSSEGRSGSSFDRMATGRLPLRPSKSYRYVPRRPRQDGLSSASQLGRSNTVSAPNPAARLPGPFDPFEDLRSPSLGSSSPRRRPYDETFTGAGMTPRGR